MPKKTRPVSRLTFRRQTVINPGVDSVFISLLRKEDSWVPSYVKKLLEVKNMKHVILLEIDKDDKQTLQDYERLKENHRIVTENCFLGENDKEAILMTYFVPSHQVIMAIEETGLYDPSTGNNMKFRNALDAVSNEEKPKRSL